MRDLPPKPAETSRVGARGHEAALEPTVMRRLAFIRYLRQEGVAQSRRPWPLSCTSLLTLHDAIEFFLLLGSQHLNVGKDNPRFMEYFALLNSKLDPATLGQQEHIRQLSNARRELKHRGLFPSTLDLESYRDAASAFFLENTPVIFGIGFDEVSLVDFVSPESARDSLREAQELIARGDGASAVNPIAFAYSEMIADYTDRKRERPGRDQFDFSSRIPSLQSLHSTLPTVEAFARETKRAIEDMQDAMRVLALGIDYRKYARFERLTPKVLRHYNGDVRLHQRFSQNLTPTVEDAQFCFDFVIESALALAEFDYSVSDE